VTRFKPGKIGSFYDLGNATERHLPPPPPSMRHPFKNGFLDVDGICSGSSIRDPHTNGTNRDQGRDHIVGRWRTLQQTLPLMCSGDQTSLDKQFR
jgi:hypothetical protein